MNALISLKFILPEIILVFGSFAVLFSNFLTRSKSDLGRLSVIISGLTLFVACLDLHSTAQLFNGLFVLDHLTHFFRIFVLISILITLLLAMQDDQINDNTKSEYYALILLMGLGLIFLSGSTNFLMIFLSLEFVSISSYLLTGFRKNNPFAKEAAIKYFLFGSLSSGLMLFGMSLIYGAVGSISLKEIVLFTILTSGLHEIFILGTVLMVAGIAFKISLSPFHFWAPDVYQGAPTPISAFLSVASKALGFAVLIRILVLLLPVAEGWAMAFLVISALTMTIGNFTALSQTNIKRFLAYSSIAHAGYILMGILVNSPFGIKASLFYLLTYLFSNFGAFACAFWMIRITGNENLESFKGLGKKSPFMALCMTVFLLSLTGLPPLAGFLGKYFVFLAAAQKELYTLLVIAAINSVVAAFYYFKIIRYMYLQEDSNHNASQSFQIPMSIWVTLITCLLSVIALGIFPMNILKLIAIAFPY